MKYTHISLFSGIGGLDIAATWAGFETIAFCEKEPFCQKVLDKHFPGVPIYEDIYTFPSSLYPRVELISGGFPCQDISNAGQGAGIEGSKSRLWFAMLDIIVAIRPRFIVAENVSALRNRGADRVLCGLEEANYAANAFVVEAGDFGAPHRRSRTFIVAENILQREVLFARGVGHFDSTREQNRRNKFSWVESDPFSGDKTRRIAMGDSDDFRELQQKRSLSSQRRWAKHAGTSDLLADNDGERFEEFESAFPEGAEHAAAERGGVFRIDTGTLSKPRLGGTVNGIPRWLDPIIDRGWPARRGESQYPWECPRTTVSVQKDRTKRLKALGNAVVPQQAFPIFAAIMRKIKEEERCESPDRL